MKTFFKIAALLALVISVNSLSAQPAQQLVRIQIAPENADWTYRPGEKVKFNVTVLKNNVPIPNVDIRYELSEDMMAPYDSGTLTLKKGSTTIDAGTLRKPGFLRCRVWATHEGREYQDRATAAFDAGSITPTVPEPDDFDTFWADKKAQLASVPVDPILTLMPERCTSTVDVYQVSLRVTHGNARVYGILCKPKAAGRYPALLHVPGAGIRPYNGDVHGAGNGFITLQIGIHGIPVDMPQGVYHDLERGPLSDYMRIKLDDKDNYYYRNVYMGCVRALDYLCGLPEWDGQNLIVQGGSQGGALSIVTAGLDERVTALMAYYPAMCDMTGYLHGRAGGWPHLFMSDRDKATPERIETVSYYDVVNFARRVKAPGLYSLGYNDMVCPPTSMYAAYNVIPAPKELYIIEELGHYQYPEQWDTAWRWIRSAVGK